MAKARVFPIANLARYFDRPTIEFLRDVFEKTGGDLTLTYDLGDATLISAGQEPATDLDKLRREVAHLRLLVASLQEQAAAVDRLRRQIDSLNLQAWGA